MTKLRAVLRRRWVLLLAGVLLGALAGLLSSTVAPVDEKVVTYRVSQLIVANRAAGQSGNVEQDALRVTRGSVAEKAAQALGLSDASAAASEVSAEADTESSSIEVSSTDRDKDVARRRVEAYVAAFLEVVNSELTADQQKRFDDLQEQIDVATQQLAEFDAKNPALVALGSAANPALLAQRAQLEQSVQTAKDQLTAERLNARSTLPYSTLGPDAPERVDSDLLPVPAGAPFRMALLGLLGAALAVGVAMVVERMIPRLDTRDELISVVDFPVLAEVGYFPRRKLPRSSNGALRLEGAWAEPYRRIRSAIQFLEARSGPGGQPPKVFMITSPSPSEGKSTTTAVTGLALAEAGVQTLVVGADFRRPSVHALLGVPSTPGLREHARMDLDRPTLDQIVTPTAHEHLYVAPSGSPGKDVVGLADAARELIAEAVSQGATVLVDTSPLEVANDAVDLLPAVDDVILVVRSGRTTQRALLHTIEQLELHGATIAGAVLIGTPGLAKQQYYHEGYYADPEAGSSDGTLFPPTPAPPAGPPGDPAAPAASGSDSPTPERAPAPVAQSTPPTWTTTPPPYRGS